MELRQLTTFRMVATLLSFSRAAESLNYVQSSVTTQIQVLEEELGVRLFDRLGKRVALTDAGKRLLQYSERILQLVDEARSVVTNEEVPGGTLTITAPETLCSYRLPALLRQFRARFPQVKLIFRLSTFVDPWRSVSEGSADIAFAIAEPIHSNALITEILIPEPMLILAPHDHRLSQSSVIDPMDLEGETFLLTEIGSYRNILERALNDVGVHLTINLDFSSVEAIKQCAMAGMGIAFLPAVTVTTDVAQGRLVALNWEGHNFQIYTQVMWHKEKWISPAIAAFLAMTREVLHP
ncbi:MAG: LysR family transcriptional regulator [Ktedonobacteraceae bacterium]|nr:LysR family transcriptional regulator [Ktedonobacteraceae bacterium]